jgi:hypothetical protein
MMNTIRKFLLGLAVACVFLCALELACRLKYHPARHVFEDNFEYDKDKIYGLKKNLKGAVFAGVAFETNSFGYRDSEIPLKKEPGALRILAVGDSVTFGHRVLARETYTEVLERSLSAKSKGRHVDVINTTVPGNSPFQEYYDLVRGLVFDPDIVIIQFSLNDVIEPFMVFRRYGGPGIDYHKVMDVPYWHYLLSEKSALYLFLQDMALKLRFGSPVQAREALIREENAQAWNVAADEPSGRVKVAWKECLKWLQREVDVCRSRKLGCILLVSPVDFQFLDTSREYAQKTLKEFARKNGIEYLDMLEALREKAREKIAARRGADANIPFPELAKERPADFLAFWQLCFVDYDHYSYVGHVFVARNLEPIVDRLIAAREEKRVDAK